MQIDARVGTLSPAARTFLLLFGLGFTLPLTPSLWTFLATLSPGRFLRFLQANSSSVVNKTGPPPSYTGRLGGCLSFGAQPPFPASTAARAGR